MGISNELPVTGYIKMVDVWMIFSISYPFIEITLHSMKEVQDYIYAYSNPIKLLPLRSAINMRRKKTANLILSTQI